MTEPFFLVKSLHPGFKIATLAMGLLVLQSSEAQAGKCPSGTVPSGTKCGIPVITYIEPLDGNGVASTISNDGYDPLNNSPYTNNVNGVSSILLEDGLNGFMHDWRFDVRGSTTRNFTVTFNSADAIAAPDPRWNLHQVTAVPPYSGAQASRGQINVQCTFAHLDMVQMTAGQSQNCPMIHGFLFVGDDNYGFPPAYSWTYPDRPETTDAQVTCNAVNATDGHCNDWYIDPPSTWLIGPAVPSGVAVGRLIHHSVVAGKGRRARLSTSTAEASTCGSASMWCGRPLIPTEVSERK